MHQSFSYYDFEAHEFKTKNIEDVALEIYCENNNKKLADISDDDLEEVRQLAQESFYGMYDRKADFAYELYMDEIDASNLPSILIGNIDWQAVANDLRNDFWYERKYGQVFVFRNY